MMRTLCAFQILLGLGVVSSGLAGVVLWPRAHAAFLPALWQGILFFISGWWGFRALCKKNRSNTDMLVAMTLTVTSVPVSVSLLTQSLCNVTSYMPLAKEIFENTQLGTRPLSLDAVLVDVAMVTCACLQILTASMTVTRMRKLMRKREEESLVRSFYTSPSGPPPQLRLPVTHAWSYTPSGALENEIPGFDRDKHFANVYAGPHGYPLPHLTSPTTQHRGK